MAEAIGLAIRNPNVYLEISEAELQPLGSAYVDAANGPLKDKIFFASAHPFFHYKDQMKLYQELPFAEDVLENVMWKNAAKMFGIIE